MRGDDLRQRPDPDADAVGDGGRAIGQADERLPTLGFVGAGKAGGTLARLCHQAGVTVAAVASRTGTHAVALAAQVGAQKVDTPDAVAALSDLTLLTVPDDAIRDVAGVLARSDVNWTGKAVIHTSGAHTLAVLEALAARGAMIGGLHPAFPFAQDNAASLSGVAFAVEAEDARLQRWLAALVSRLGGLVLTIPPGGKAVYHAALIIASNYAVTLYATAERLMLSLGAERETSSAALNALVTATTENLRVHGIPAALTGPLVRGDLGTVKAHLRALRTADPAVLEVYRALARLSYPMLAARGVNTEAVERLLKQDEDDDTVDDTGYSQAQGGG